jgi:hypothetical protein
LKRSSFHGRPPLCGAALRSGSCAGYIGPAFRRDQNQSNSMPIYNKNNKNKISTSNGLGSKCVRINWKTIIGSKHAFKVKRTFHHHFCMFVSPSRFRLYPFYDKDRPGYADKREAFPQRCICGAKPGNPATCLMSSDSYVNVIIVFYFSCCACNMITSVIGYNI